MYKIDSVIESRVRVRGSFQKHSPPGLSHGSKEGGGGYDLGILSAEGGGYLLQQPRDISSFGLISCIACIRAVPP